jgi:hypothetical protein
MFEARAPLAVNKKESELIAKTKRKCLDAIALRLSAPGLRAGETGVGLR